MSKKNSSTDKKRQEFAYPCTKVGQNGGLRRHDIRTRRDQPTETHSCSAASPSKSRMRTWNCWNNSKTTCLRKTLQFKPRRHQHRSTTLTKQRSEHQLFLILKPTTTSKHLAVLINTIVLDSTCMNWDPMNLEKRLGSFSWEITMTSTVSSLMLNTLASSKFS